MILSLVAKQYNGADWARRERELKRLQTHSQNQHTFYVWHVNVFKNRIITFEHFMCALFFRKIFFPPTFFLIIIFASLVLETLWWANSNDQLDNDCMLCRIGQATSIGVLCQIELGPSFISVQNKNSPSQIGDTLYFIWQKNKQTNILKMQSNILYLVCILYTYYSCFVYKFAIKKYKATTIIQYDILVWCQFIVDFNSDLFMFGTCSISKYHHYFFFYLSSMNFYHKFLFIMSHK